MLKDKMRDPSTKVLAQGLRLSANALGAAEDAFAKLAPEMFPPEKRGLGYAFLNEVAEALETGELVFAEQPQTQGETA